MTVAIWMGIMVGGYLLGSIPDRVSLGESQGHQHPDRRLRQHRRDQRDARPRQGPGIGGLADRCAERIPRRSFSAPLLFPALHRSALQIVACVCVIARAQLDVLVEIQRRKGIPPAPARCWPCSGAIALVFGVWLIVFALSRYVSLASIAAAVALPVATWFARPDLVWFSAVLSGVAIWKHKSTSSDSGRHGKSGGGKKNDMKVTVIGTGGWGTALDVVARQRAPRDALGTAARRGRADSRVRENKAFLPGVKIPDAITATLDTHAALRDAELVVLAVRRMGCDRFAGNSEILVEGRGTRACRQRHRE